MVNKLGPKKKYVSISRKTEKRTSVGSFLKTGPKKINPKLSFKISGSSKREDYHDDAASKSRPSRHYNASVTSVGPSDVSYSGGGGGGSKSASNDQYGYSNSKRVDLNDFLALGRLACTLSPIAKVDPRSIGASALIQLQAEAAASKSMSKTAPSRQGKFTSRHHAANQESLKDFENNPASLTNECLLLMRVNRFEVSAAASGYGGINSTARKNRNMKKHRNKPRYICIIRSTNRPVKTHQNSKETKSEHQSPEDHDENLVDGNEVEDTGYDAMYSPADVKSEPSSPRKRNSLHPESHPQKDLRRGGLARVDMKKSTKDLLMDEQEENDAQDEISGFPILLCLALHADGSSLEIRNTFELEQLVSVECISDIAHHAIPENKNKLENDNENSGTVHLVFRSGETVEIECGSNSAGGSNTLSGARDDASLQIQNGRMDSGTRKDLLLWSLLQIHAILCISVVQQCKLADGTKCAPLPPLAMRDVDRTELQYLCTVNKFLNSSPGIMGLLQRERYRQLYYYKTQTNKNNEDILLKDLEDLAYDMMMTIAGGEDDGHHTMGVAIFTSTEEEKDAEEVLNSTQVKAGQLALASQEHKGNGEDAICTAESLTELLQKKMRDLEADACRRLIAWEDEKQQAEGMSIRNQRDFIDAPNLVSLFATLDQLDAELAKMEIWLKDRATFIKPLTDDCREIEETNTALEQQWKSYNMLGTGLSRLMNGLDVSQSVMKILRDPRSVLTIKEETGKIDVDKAEKGVDKIQQAGKELKKAFNSAANEGGVHLRAVNERVEDLIIIANKFCSEISKIIIEVMRSLATEMITSMDAGGKTSKPDTHAAMAKKIRDAQRGFQSSLLMYIKLIEVLALLKPETLPEIRKVYSDLVAEGILSKKRMKVYFHLLPGYTKQSFVVVGEQSSLDLKDYPPCSLKHGGGSVLASDIVSVNAEDIGLALTEMLPVIAREAYFTAALFGLSGKNLDGRAKKRNFEAAKKSVDDSSVYFRYYLSRACGIAETEGGKASNDCMLSLVASIHLNESMEGYIDRQKKGGDHSLSLAYVRATILDFRKKVDKKWVGWIEENIKYTRSNPGVPLTGKRAGVFMTFARFPSYLDHITCSCQAGFGNDHSVNLSKIKVVSYYLQKMAGALFASLHECAERETTDQQYAANVMRMENAHFFTETIRKRGSELSHLFQKQLTAAGAIYKQSTDSYLGWMIKREFKVLHSLFSNVSRIRREVGDADVPIHIPKTTFVKTLTKESSREVMKEKIGAIYLRMEKHLSEVAALLPHAWKSLVRVLYEWFGRWEKLGNHCYDFKLEPGAVEVVRIAKTVGGGGSSVERRKETVGPSAPRSNAPRSNAPRSSNNNSSHGSTPSSPRKQLAG